MTTKKSKPASLTSSLLARKGEAEPAAAPYSIPESGRERPADSMVSKGNGNGGDLGHALSGMTRLPSIEHDAKSVGSEKTTAPAAASPPERQPERVVPPEQPAAPAIPRFELPETRADRRPEAAAPEIARPEKQPVRNGGADAEQPEKFSAEEIILESATAEEASVDEAMIDAAIASSGAPGAHAWACIRALGRCGGERGRREDGRHRRHRIG